MGRGAIGVITTRKRSLGQGNIFTPVCHSVHGGGGYPSIHCRWYPSMPCSKGVCYPSMPCSRGGAWSGEGLLPGGGLLLGGVYSQGGSAGGGRGCLVETSPGLLLLWAVHILLECILVFYIEPYNPFVHVLVLVPVPVPETAIAIKP